MLTSSGMTPLLTDLYELTMAYGWWRSGRTDQRGVFHLFFRKNPFAGGFTVAAGLESAIEWLRSFHFSTEDLSFLATLEGADGRPMFDRSFLDWLGGLSLTLDIDAVPEGTVAFPLEPLVRVRGRIIEAQLIESALLNIINFQSLIATKSARVNHAAAGQTVLEFGLRRAQGPDGSLSASRAAFIGGCTGTSNVLAAKLYDIPAVGTHAHSWVSSFDSEVEAFETYAAAMPGNTLLLVDTYDTLEGVRHAAAVGRSLREAGHQFLGIRLDSGDLAWLSIEARKILDEAGLADAKIVASNDLDEHLITSLRLEGAQIDTWAVGTKLVTGDQQSALGGVYKLTAVARGALAANQPPAGTGLKPVTTIPLEGSDVEPVWEPRIKVSEEAVKTTIPGILQTRRYSHAGIFIGDMIYDDSPSRRMIDPADPLRSRDMSDADAQEDLLVPVFRGSQLVYELPSLREIQARAKAQLARLDHSITRFANPHRYPVGLSEPLQRRRSAMIERARASQDLS